MRWLVVGLGNPGPRYANNRHTIGFAFIDECMRRHGGAMRSACGAHLAEVCWFGHKVVLIKPMTYMNGSGVCVAEAAAFFEVPPTHMVVAHDDVDLDFARLKVKVGGGHGGHNGLRSVFEHVGRDFVRIRFGVGRPITGDVVSHVLGDFDPAERRELKDVIDRAVIGLESILREGPTAAMNRCNGASDLVAKT